MLHCIVQWDVFCVFSAVTWQGQEARLVLHYDTGFTLTISDKKSEDKRKAPILWHFPYEKLRMSADDGHRLLWLDFGEDGEQVSHSSDLFIYLF